MKVFWSILAVLAIAATVLLAVPRKGGGAAAGPATPEAVTRDTAEEINDSKATPLAAAKSDPKGGRRSEPDDEPESAMPPPGKPVEAAAVKPVEEIKPTPPPPPAAHAAVPAADVKPATATPESADAAKPASGASTPADKPAAAAPELPGKINELVESALGNGEPAKSAPGGVPADGAKDAKPAELPGAPVAAGAKIEAKEDGSMLVDGRFPIKGKGTKAEPYVITWDYLISAEETYRPRLGQKDLPARMSIVKGKWVKITGYVAFPIMAQEADEMLAMLNQWDGCCIGVPPTPYDAIEVKLRDPAEKEDRFAVYGAVTGRLDIEPYLVKDWLIGLYTMSDAVLKAER